MAVSRILGSLKSIVTNPTALAIGLPIGFSALYAWWTRSRAEKGYAEEARKNLSTFQDVASGGQGSQVPGAIPSPIENATSSLTKTEKLKAFLAPVAKDVGVNVDDLYADYMAMLSVNEQSDGKLKVPPNKLEAAATALSRRLSALPTEGKKEIQKALSESFNGTTINVKDDEEAARLRRATVEFGESVVVALRNAPNWMRDIRTLKSPDAEAQKQVAAAKAAGVSVPQFDAEGKVVPGYQQAAGGNHSSQQVSQSNDYVKQMLAQSGYQLQGDGSIRPVGKTQAAGSAFNDAMAEFQKYLPAIASAGWAMAPNRGTMDFNLMTMMASPLLGPEDITIMAGISDPVQKAAYVAQKQLTRQQILMQFLTQMSRMLADTAKMIIGNLR